MAETVMHYSSPTPSPRLFRCGGRAITPGTPRNGAATVTGSGSGSSTSKSTHTIGTTPISSQKRKIGLSDNTSSVLSREGSHGSRNQIGDVIGGKTSPSSPSASSLRRRLSGVSSQSRNTLLSADSIGIKVINNHGRIEQRRPSENLRNSTTSSSFLQHHNIHQRQHRQRDHHYHHQQSSPPKRSKVDPLFSGDPFQDPISDNAHKFHPQQQHSSRHIFHPSPHRLSQVPPTPPVPAFATYHGVLSANQKPGIRYLGGSVAPPGTKIPSVPAPLKAGPTQFEEHRGNRARSNLAPQKGRVPVESPQWMSGNPMQPTSMQPGESSRLNPAYWDPTRTGQASSSSSQNQYQSQPHHLPPIRSISDPDQIRGGTSHIHGMYDPVGISNVAIPHPEEMDRAEGLSGESSGSGYSGFSAPPAAEGLGLEPHPRPGPSGVQDHVRVSGADGDIPKKKRNRALMSEHQQKTLSVLWKQTKFPLTHEREEVAATLGLTPRVVQVWFQNRRQTFRKQINQNTVPENSDPLDYADLQKSPRTRRLDLENAKAAERDRAGGMPGDYDDNDMRNRMLRSPISEASDPGMPHEPSLMRAPYHELSPTSVMRDPRDRPRLEPPGSARRAGWFRDGAGTDSVVDSPGTMWSGPLSPPQRRASGSALSPHRRSFSNTRSHPYSPPIPGQDHRQASPRQQFSRYDEFSNPAFPNHHPEHRMSFSQQFQESREAINRAQEGHVNPRETTDSSPEGARPLHLPPSLAALAITKPIDQDRPRRDSFLPSLEYSESADALRSRSESTLGPSTDSRSNSDFFNNRSFQNSRTNSLSIPVSASASQEWIHPALRRPYRPESGSSSSQSDIKRSFEPLIQGQGDVDMESPHTASNPIDDQNQKWKDEGRTLPPLNSPQQQWDRYDVMVKDRNRRTSFERGTGSSGPFSRSQGGDIQEEAIDVDHDMGEEKPREHAVANVGGSQLN